MKRRDFITKGVRAGVVAGMGFSLLPQEAKADAIEEEVKPIKHKCKITVLRREFFEDLKEQYLANPNVGKCEVCKDGQEWLIDENEYYHMLNGTFCAQAWSAVNKFVYAALQGGSLERGWTKDENMTVVSCSSGIRPVFFKIERIDE